MSDTIWWTEYKGFFTREKNCIYTVVNIDKSISITKYDIDGNVTGKLFIPDNSDVNVSTVSALKR